MRLFKSLLITGGAGFIGSHVVRYMVNNYPNTQIVNLDALTYAANLELLNDCIDQPNYEFIHEDITNFNQLSRFSDSCGAEIPRWIKNRLSDYADDSQSIYKFGIEIVSDLCQKLISNRVPGLHFYSMNRSKATLDILKNLGIKT